MPRFRAFVVINDEPYDPPFGFDSLEKAQAHIKEYRLTNVAIYRLVPRKASDEASYDYEVEGWFST